MNLASLWSVGQPGNSPRQTNNAASVLHKSNQRNKLVKVMTLSLSLSNKPRTRRKKEKNIKERGNVGGGGQEEK